MKSKEEIVKDSWSKKVFLSDSAREECFRVMEEYAQQFKDGTPADEAIEFGIFLTKGHAETLAEDHWRYNYNTTHTTAQLYKLFSGAEQGKEDSEWQNVHDNSDGFRDFLDSKGIKYIRNDHWTMVNKAYDLYWLGRMCEQWKQENQGKEATPVKEWTLIGQCGSNAVKEDKTEQGISIDELKQRFAEHLMTKNKELDTSDGYALEWTVKQLKQ